MKARNILKAAYACAISLLFLNASVAQQTTYQTLISPSDSLRIMRKPHILDFSVKEGRCVIENLPESDESNYRDFEIDIRSCDLSGIDLSDRLDQLMFADFDSKTKWPESIPPSFDPDKFMEHGMGPGLGVRELHASGITGKNIGIAIIDQALLVDHIEYKDQLRSYEEIHYTGQRAEMHGPAVASIAVGRKVGVAPDADLYHIACRMGDYLEDDSFERNLEYVAQSIERIIDINHTLPADRKIRVISISLELMPRLKNYEIVRKAIQKAEEENIVTIHVGSQPCQGLGREPMNDPELTSSYSAGLFWGDRATIDSTYLLVPMDSRCTASPTGDSDYVFYRSGGLSWAVPYLAGLYALACQCDSDITFREFWKLLDKTSVPVKQNGRIMGKAVHPLSIKELKK